MTREEAIKELRRLHYAYKADEHGDYFYDNADDVCQAAAVAISALREPQIPCEPGDTVQKIRTDA